MPIEGPAESVTERITERPTERLTPVASGEPSTVTLTINTTDQPTRIPIELRVHGVTGTPAEQMLDRQIIGHVAGDGEAGFFRPRAEYGAAHIHGPGGARLEAYRWGNLTAGAAARALLVADASVHAGQRRDVDASAGDRRGQGIVRGLTPHVRPDDDRHIHAGRRGRRARPRRLAVRRHAGQPVHRGEAVDAVRLHGLLRADRTAARADGAGADRLVCLLWCLARRTWARYESFAMPEVSPEGDGLATPTFWDGRAQVSRLRSLHMAAAFAIIDAVLVYVLMRHDLSRRLLRRRGPAGRGTVHCGHRRSGARLGSGAVLALCCCCSSSPAWWTGTRDRPVRASWRRACARSRFS